MTQVELNNLVEYKGSLTFPVIEELLLSTKEKIESMDLEFPVYRRLYAIMVECLENSLKHQIILSQPLKHKTTEVMLSSSDDEFIFSIGNYITHDKVNELITKINEVNSLNLDGLNKMYRESIMKTRISEKGGAGLGIIEIARNSRKQIKYFIHREENDFSFFIFEVSLAKQLSKS